MRSASAAQGATIVVGMAQVMLSTMTCSKDQKLSMMTMVDHVVRMENPGLVVLMLSRIVFRQSRHFRQCFGTGDIVLKVTERASPELSLSSLVP